MQSYYRPQTKFAKVMFLHLSVSHSVHEGGVCGGGACVAWGDVGGMCGGGRGCVWQGGMHGRGVHGRGHAWWGACVAWGGVWGGMCGRGKGCVWQGGHAWQGGAWQGACMAGGMHGGEGVHAWQGVCMVGRPAWQILRDTVNERAARILLECILVSFLRYPQTTNLV